MPTDAEGSVLSMLDITLTEFEELYYANEKLFRSVNNWFYFANNKKISSLASKGYVCYGRNRARTKSFGFPQDDHGGLVLLCTGKVDMNVLRAKCSNEKNGLVRFELEDGTQAHYGILKDAIGACGPKGEYPVLIIQNKPQTKAWPYSLHGNTTFHEASREEGTLPHYVSSGEIMKILPARIKEDLSI